MKLRQQLKIIIDLFTNLLLSGKNYSIFIDVKRSQVLYVKYVENKDMIIHNIRKGDQCGVNRKEAGDSGTEDFER